jgi:hypothetical protein
MERKSTYTALLEEIYRFLQQFLYFEPDIGHWMVCLTEASTLREEMQWSLQALSELYDVQTQKIILLQFIMRTLNHS